MSNTLNGSDFGDKLYQSLPEIYRTVDKENNLALKRYLQSLSDGGYAKVIDEMNNLLNLNNSEKAPIDVLRIAFKHYGLDAFQSIPEAYLRRLYPLLQTLYASKGTHDVLEYLSSTLSETKSYIEVDEDFKNNYKINLKLEMDYGMGEGETHSIPDLDDMSRLVKEFVPFFVQLTVVYVYIFYESASVHLTPNEYFEDIIETIDLKHDINVQDELSSFMLLFDPFLESGELKSEEYDTLIGVLKLMHDVAKIKVSENESLNVKHSVLSDDIAFSRSGNGSSIFETGDVFDSMIFDSEAKGEQVEYYMDKITYIDK